MEVSTIQPEQAMNLLSSQEGHFLDFKGRAIGAAKLTKALSAFANADGGELYIGVSETQSHTFDWNGFPRIEDANGHIQHLEAHFPFGGDFQYEFLGAENYPGYLLRVSILKSREIRTASDGIAYLRRGAQSLPVVDADALARLRLVKGLASHEDETVQLPLDELTNSEVIIEFMLDVIPQSEPEPWLRKQQLVIGDLPTVAGALLFADEPQIALPKATVKIYRYRTSDAEGSRETLAFDPISIDGDIYHQIRDAVNKTVELTEEIQKMTTEGLTYIQYPKVALHEVITNSVLHRDYSHNDDVHVRIFDNRIEVESPGRLPAHITPSNILRERFARNQKLVRLVNKFPDPPNKDVGEGLNTAFAAMANLRLKKPEIVERNTSVLVTIKHESLASPEQQITEHLHSVKDIGNAEARVLTGVTSDRKIRSCFQKLVKAGEIEQVPGTIRGTTRYQLPNAKRLPEQTQ
jgi:ATP-dependent DNA helicase RecG